MSKQTINLSIPNPTATSNYSLPHYQGCGYDTQYHAWSINSVNGFFKFNLNLPQKQGVNLIFQLGSSSENGRTNCPINITVNGQLLVRGFDPHITSFYDMVWSVPANMLQAGNNEIILTLIGGTTKVFMKYAIVDIYSVPPSKKNWLSSISDSTDISEINLPGTHDAAAINSTITTPYSCHNQSITDQLNGGIRILDVRLKVQKTNNQYAFITCHGDIGSSAGINEYQSFPSLLDECKNFLTANNTETVIMTLKVDDWNGYENDSINVLNSLYSLISLYPIKASNHMLQLGDVRTKIVLFNRINDELRFGTPISWTDNTPGSYANNTLNRTYNLYVQDQYSGLPTLDSNQYKLDLVTSAFSKKQQGVVVLNFASAVWYGIIGVYIMGDLLSYFGANIATHRPQLFGWIMFDYEFEQYNTDTYSLVNIVDLVISSNFNFNGFEHKFNVIGHDAL